MSTGNFRRGSEAAEAAASKGNFAKTQWLRLEDKQRVLVRFLHEAFDTSGVESWIVADQHQMVPTKNQPDGYEGKWPKYMSAVCRRDEAFSYGECFICDFLVPDDKAKPATSRVWSLACLREEVLGDGSEALGGPEMKGKTVGVRDQTREVVIPARPASDGKAATEERHVTEKDIVVVNFGWRNFFLPLQGFASHFGQTILDRDYWITRQGSMTDTTYHFVPIDPVPTADGTTLDLRNPEHAKRYETADIDLGEIVSGLAADDYYARFFDPRVSVDGGKVVNNDEATMQQQAKPSTEVDPEMLQQMAARVKGYSQSGVKDLD